MVKCGSCGIDIKKHTMKEYNIKICLLDMSYGLQKIKEALE